MNKPYFIALDLDGTLLDDDKNISEFNKKTLDKCQKLGHKIALCTNRSYLRTLPYAEEINADYIVCFDGNYVVSDNVIYSNKISSKLAKTLTSLLKEKNVDFIVECLNGAYRSRINEYSFIETNFIKFDNFDFSNCFKVLVDCNIKNIADLNEITNNLNLSGSFDEENNLYRILPKKTGKWNGLNKIDLTNYLTISFGNDKSDLEMLLNSDVGIKMKESTNELEKVKFWTDSNNQDGVGKFLNHYFNFDLRSCYENIKILDCTLRDGGHLNNSSFGKKTINSIIDNLIKANIDIVEIGFLEDCECDENRACFPTVLEAEKLLQDKDTKSTSFSLLTQVDKFNIANLTPYKDKIKMIRVSFHNHLIDQGMEYCKKVIEMGYVCSCNPINFSSYTKEEIIKLTKKVNLIKPDYFAVVDTFGIMLNNDFTNKIHLLNHLLSPEIKLGLHLHDNLSSSFSTAQILLQEESRFHDIIIDTSLSGMGRSPGNLKTELLAYYINTELINKYNMKYIYSLIENELKELSNHLHWSFDFAYSISAFEKVHRTYAEYLASKNYPLMLIDSILKEIPQSKKGRFDLNFIRALCQKYDKEVK